jgi:hypothetical protein
LSTSSRCSDLFKLKLRANERDRFKRKSYRFQVDVKPQRCSKSLGPKKL